MTHSRIHTIGPILLGAMLLIACLSCPLQTEAQATRIANRKTVSGGKKTTADSDTLSKKEKMALQLIESVNNLSRTASQLSETAHEILFSKSKKEGQQYKEEPDDLPEEDHTVEFEETIIGNEDERPALQKKGPYIEWEEDEEPETLPAPTRQFPFIALEDIQDTQEETSDGEEEEGGSFVWVPNSLLGKVQAMVDGEETEEYYGSPAENAPATTYDTSLLSSLPTAPQQPTDPMEEKVTFRGDTINMVIRDRRFGRFDRKLFNYLILPKGTWNCNLTASYGELNTNDLEMMSLLTDITLGGYIFSIKPAISYCIRDNMAIGLRLSYTKGHGSIDSFKVDIDDDMNFALAGVAYDSESYQASFTLTRYLGLSRRGRFSLTNELEVAFASGNSDFVRPFNGQPKETHTTTMAVGVTYSPGISVMIMRNVSFDISFGVFGFRLKSEKQTVDGLPAGRRTTSGANFRWNIFNLNFGIGVHI